MPNINQSLLKDYLILDGVPSSVTYYLQNWNGLGISSESVSSGSPFGTIYNPGNVINFNTLSLTFIIDEEWKVFEEIFNLIYKNAPLETDDYEKTIFDAQLHIMNNTYKKEVGYIQMYGAYIESVMNVDHSYNVADDTEVKTINAILHYQYHKFFRNDTEE